MQWHPETEPFVVQWEHPTGDRLTRRRTTLQSFADRDAALDAARAPFGRNTAAVIVKHFAASHVTIIASRRNGKPLRAI
jgi:hypothetical protein